jgi:hypothetical protein
VSERRRRRRRAALPSFHSGAVAVLAGGAALDQVPRARPSSMATGVVIHAGRRGGGARRHTGGHSGLLRGGSLSVVVRHGRHIGRLCGHPFRASQRVHPHAPPSGGSGGAGSLPSPELCVLRRASKVAATRRHQVNPLTRFHVRLIAKSVHPNLGI